ncbi:reverse transcriptase domain-containing protein [Tanacetum coccineum]
MVKNASGAITNDVPSAGQATASPAKGEKNTNPATTDAEPNLHDELVDLLDIHVVTQYYNKKLLYDKYYDKMLKRRKSSKITNYDVLTQKGPISLKVHREDGTSEVILNVKKELQFSLVNNSKLNVVYLLNRRLKCLFHFKKVYMAGKRLLYVKMNKAISLGKGASKVDIEVQQLSLKDCTCSKEITPQFSFNHLAIPQARFQGTNTFQYPVGIAKNMLVEVGKFTFLVDFVILKMEEDKEDFDALLDKGSKIFHSIEGTIFEEKLFAEFNEFMAMTADENSESESDNEEPPFEKITFNTDHKIKTSLEEPPLNLELKPPDNLEYVFLEEPSFLPVIISSQLSEQNKNKLISVLKRHKQAFAWKITDIPGISGRNLFDAEASSSNNTGAKPPIPPKTLHEYSHPNPSGFQNPITFPTEQTRRIVDSSDIWLIQKTCTFQGLRNKDPLRHVKNYLSIVDNIQADRAIRDTSRLRFFHFSLKGKASEWLDRIPPTQITTWDQLVSRFLDHFFPNDDTPPWGNIKRKEKGEDGPKWIVRNKFEDDLANFMLEKKSHAKGIGNMLDQHPSPRPTYDNLTEGEIEKERPENEEPSIVQEPIPRPSIFYQPSKSSNLPFPSRLKKQKKDDEDEWLLSIFKQIHINLPFLEAMIHMPKGAKVLKDLLLHKEKLEKAASSVKLSEECSVINQRSLPQKEGDPGSFTLPCLIGPLAVKNALADLGASINLMPHSLFRRLGIYKLKPTKMSIQLADRSIKYPHRDMLEDIRVPLILGRPFLSIACAKIDVYKRKITLRVKEERIIFTSVKPASSLIKTVYMLSFRERMELDLEARLIGETLVLNRSLDTFFEDYIELNYLNEPFELRRNQGDDLMPTIEKGEVIEEFRTKDDELDVGINDYPSYCDYDKKIHIDFLENIDAYRDEGMGDVIFGEPFLREVRINAKRFDGMITIYNDNDEVTYQMVRSHPRFKYHTNEQCNNIPPLLKVSEEDKMNGISHSYQKLKGFYKGVLNLGPDYIRDAKMEEWLTRGHISVHEME